MPGGFWQAVLDSGMSVPPQRPLNDLTAELVAMLGSASPVERQTIARPVLTAWLADGVYDDLLVSVGDALALGLRWRLGNAGDETVLRRSYSALMLAACVDRDNSLRLLPVDAVVTWADRALTWYVREQDLRGTLPHSGWAGAVSHGADLLTALGQSRHLGTGQLSVMLDVVAERLTRPTSVVFVDGEEDRLAQATLTILQRDLIETSWLEEWVGGLAGSLTSAGRGGTGRTTASERNTSAFLRALYLHLAVGIHPVSTTLSFAAPPRCRADLLLALLEAVPRHTPWLYRQ